MPIFTEYSRENEAPPEPIGTDTDDHDPHDDRHDPDGLEIPDDFYTALDQANQILDNEDV